MSRTRFAVLLSRAVPVVLLAVLTACGSGDDPTGGVGPSDDDVIGSTPGASLSGDVQPLFERHSCTESACHGAAATFGLDLRPAFAHRDLVGVASVGDPVRTRVIPGDAQNSYLIWKLEGRHTAGQLMPLGGEPMTTGEIARIRAWIDEGARNN